MNKVKLTGINSIKAPAVFKNDQNINQVLSLFENEEIPLNVPFKDKQTGLFNADYDFLGRDESYFYLSACEEEQKEFVKSSQIYFNNTAIFGRKQKDVYIFDSKKVKRFSKKKDIESIVSRFRDKESEIVLKDKFLAPAEIYDIVKVAIPFEIEKREQKREAPRYEFPNRKSPTVKAYGRDYEVSNITGIMNLGREPTNQLKQFLDRVDKHKKEGLYGMILTNYLITISKINELFLGAQCRSVFCPYDPITKLMPKREAEFIKEGIYKKFGDKSPLVTPEHPDYLKLKGNTISMKEESHNNKISSFPVNIYGRQEGVCIGLGHHNDKINDYLREATKIYSYGCENLPRFDISTGKNLKMKDISAKGCKLESNDEKYRRLQENNRLWLDFPILGTNGVQTRITMDSKVKGQVQMLDETPVKYVIRLEWIESKYSDGNTANISKITNFIKKRSNVYDL